MSPGNLRSFDPVELGGHAFGPHKKVTDLISSKSGNFEAGLSAKATSSDREMIVRNVKSARSVPWFRHENAPKWVALAE